jgi:hypothetical protein
VIPAARLRVVAAGLAIAALATEACDRASPQPQAAAARGVVWRKLGAWSGSGSRQTESFTSESGALRVRWETRLPGPGAAPGGQGLFRLNAHSAISGRLLQPVVDQSGAGSGIGYVQQDPHVFYVVVESNALNWSFTVEEAVGYP